MTSAPRLIPELDVTNLDLSIDFYTRILGFVVDYERAEERFVALSIGGASLMLEEAAGPGRRFHKAELERPFGRGINLQIEVDNVDEIHARVLEESCEIVIPLEETWYRMATSTGGNRQFVVADPDGYLLRFFQDISNVEAAGE